MFDPRKAGAGSHNDPNALSTKEDRNTNRVNKYITLSAEEADELHRMAIAMRATNSNVCRAALKLLHTQLTKRGML